MGVLYIVATPIGNLGDITLRAIDVLKSADLILAEDTRVAQKLLIHYEIKQKILRYDEYSKSGIYEEIKQRLQRDENVALVSDAGTPGISDPGSRLVDFVRRELPVVKILPIPGPSALIAALSASGLRGDEFTFLGYPPHKKGRQKFFKALKGIKTKPIILYESPYRLEDAFRNLKTVFGENYEIVVAKELTKIYEEIFKGTVAYAQEYFVGEKKKGEFVLIIP